MMENDIKLLRELKKQFIQSREAEYTKTLLDRSAIIRYTDLIFALSKAIKMMKAEGEGAD